MFGEDQMLSNFQEFRDIGSRQRSKGKINMKIDTSEPRLPLNRLKHPLEPKSTLPAAAAENETEKVDHAEFSDAFERAIIKRGARKFQEWLDELDIK